MGDKGLALIYDPHNLYQFVWYYCNKGKEKKWDALCLPNGIKGEYMHPFCEKAGLFERIYVDDIGYESLPIYRKLIIFLKMFSFYLFGKRKELCKDILNQYVNLDEYDELVVLADVGVVSGACVALGDEKKVIILEDGINDYGKRINWMPINKINSFYAWQGFILSKMGYCSPGWFELNTDRLCIKYCSHPAKMQYTSYKEMRVLYSNNETDMTLFNKILCRLYQNINMYDFEKIDTVIMTRPISDFVDNDKKYIDRLRVYISNNYKSVLLKKHPREQCSYSFGETKVIEMASDIPVEVLLPFLRGKKLVLVTASSVLLYLKPYELSCDIVLFKGLYEESMKSNSNWKAASIDDVETWGQRFCDGSYKIVLL